VILEREELFQVRNSPLFSGMEEKEVRDILDGTGILRKIYRKGEWVYRPHDFSRKLGILLSGAISVSKGAFPVSRLKPGDLFGAAALYNEEPDYVTTLYAAADCVVLLISQERVEDLLDARPLVRRNYIRYLSGRIRFLSGKMEELTGPTAEAKVFHYLAQRAREGRVELDCSLTELAKRLSIGRASLYRVLDALEEEKRIKRSGKRIFLLKQGKE